VYTDDLKNRTHAPRRGLIYNIIIPLGVDDYTVYSKENETAIFFDRPKSRRALFLQNTLKSALIYVYDVHTASDKSVNVI